MTRLRLGINTCFTATRWPKPEDKFRVVRDELGLDTVQYSLDAFDANLPLAYRERLYASIRESAAKHGVSIHSVFTGAGHHFDNLLMHPDQEWRANAEQWFDEAFRLAAAIGAQGGGGFVGAMSFADIASPDVRTRRWTDLVDSLVRLSRVAAKYGNAFFLVEPMSVKREPPSTIDETLELLHEVNKRADAPMRLCLDVGHYRTVSAPTPDDRDPYAWLARCAPWAPCVHVHQTDTAASRHWPFTEENNRKGLIESCKLCDAIQSSGAEEVVLLIEVFSAPYEPMDDRVLHDLNASVSYWQRTLCADLSVPTQPSRSR